MDTPVILPNWLHPVRFAAQAKPAAAASDAPPPVPNQSPTQAAPFFTDKPFPHELEQAASGKPKWLRRIASLFVSPPYTLQEQRIDELLDSFQAQLKLENFGEIKREEPKVVKVQDYTCTISMPLTVDCFYAYWPVDANIPLTKFTLNGVSMQFRHDKAEEHTVFKRNGHYEFRDAKSKLHRYWLFGEKGNLYLDYKPLVWRRPTVTFEEKDPKRQLVSHNRRLVKKTRRVMKQLIACLKKAPKVQEAARQAQVQMARYIEKMQEDEALKNHRLSL